MDAFESLRSIAEIAATLIGFSGLIFVFRARDVTELEPRDLAGLAQILGAGSIALAFALLPLPLAYVDMAEDVRWRLMSGALAAVLLVAAWIFRSVSARLTRTGHPERTPTLNRSIFATLLVLAALLVAAASGDLPGPPIYLFVLIVCLLLCLVFVIFTLVIARQLGTQHGAADGDRAHDESASP